MKKRKKKCQNSALVIYASRPSGTLHWCMKDIDAWGKTEVKYVMN